MPICIFHYVPQTHENSCGFACAAMIAGIEYDEATESYTNAEINEGLRSSEIMRIVRRKNRGVSINIYPKYDKPKLETTSCLSIIDFKNKFESRIQKLNVSLLIRVKFNGKLGSNVRLGHWVLYDSDCAIGQEIKDPVELYDSPIGIDKFVEDYFRKCKYIKFRLITESKIGN